ncbi:MAG: hypothetical protein CMJ38_08290 [Phycisphaerae bacterium]|nr:hypothetical protein [Phycisphaerae bacterium]
MAKKPISFVAWIAPSQTDLLLEVQKLKGVKCVAVGTSDLNASTDIATALKAEHCADLRTMVTQYDDAPLWIAEPSAYDSSLCELLRSRTTPSITSTPLNGSLMELVHEAGKTPAAFYVPLLRRSKAHGELLDDIEQFGLPELLHITLTCSQGEGTLSARLFDAMDFIDNVIGTPESVHAICDSEVVPEEACDLRGNMTVHLAFPNQRSATLLLSDQTDWHRSIYAINKEHSLLTEDDLTFASLIHHAIETCDELSSGHTHADAPRVLALCEAARLSCLTGAPELTSSILGMFES